MTPAVVLLSGGLDSATTLAIARSLGFDAHALSIDYGQRHRVELERARELASTLGARRHVIVAVDLRAIGHSALTDDIDVPKDRSDAEMGSDIPATYVPARNTVFLSIALAFAESVEASDIFIGANVLDYSGYPDCRPEYLCAFAAMAQLATKAGVEGTARYRIHAPLIQWNKSEIILKGLELGVDFSKTISCYDPDGQGRACGRCDSCMLRKKGFAEAGVADPTRYQ